MDQNTGFYNIAQATKVVIGTGAIAGTLDIVVAFINYFLSTGKSPVIVLNYIASGVFGRDAYADGFTMPFIGLLFHYIIATSWTALFFFLYPKIKILSRNRFLSGIGYGAFVWLMMNQVVLPLSNVHQFPFDIVRAIEGIGILMVCVGMPISLIVGKYLSEKQSV
jgi:hypothetical protein